MQLAQSTILYFYTQTSAFASHMRNFRLIYSLYFLPVFFFTMAAAPNISGDRIGLVLIAIYTMLIPATNYIVVRSYRMISSAGDKRFAFLDFLALLMLASTFYLGWQINWQFNMLQILYLTFVAGAYNNLFIQGKINLLVVLILGSVLYSMTYIGLNKYGFGQLFRLHNFAVILYCGLLITPIFYMEEGSAKPFQLIKTVSIVLFAEILSFAIFFLISYKWEYTVLFVVAMLPSAGVILGMYRELKTSDRIATRRFFLLRLIYAISMTGFFIYFFLDSTQVLQAIRGGY
jgi:hypothetical protein